MSERNIDIRSYSQRYIEEHGKEISYEAIIAEVRKQCVLDNIKKYKHERIIEIGCGLDPLFRYLDDYKNYTIVEPGEEFVSRARLLAAGNKRVEVIKGFLEDVAEQLITGKKQFDFIIASSLLHEVPDAERLLKSIINICGYDTVIHINVPNVFSFHRLLALEMGIINDIFQKSEMETKFQRHGHYDKKQLIDLVEKEGLSVLNFGTYFIKPFTNGQMEKLIAGKIVSPQIIDGLDKMIKYMPDLGCEMYVNIRKRT